MKNIEQKIKRAVVRYFLGADFEQWVKDTSKLALEVQEIKWWTKHVAEMAKELSSIKESKEQYDALVGRVAEVEGDLEDIKDHERRIESLEESLDDKLGEDGLRDLEDKIEDVDMRLEEVKDNVDDLANRDTEEDVANLKKRIEELENKEALSLPRQPLPDKPENWEAVNRKLEALQMRQDVLFRVNDIIASMAERTHESMKHERVRFEEKLCQEQATEQEAK